MSDDPRTRFRKAFWRAFREADSIRLRQWERSGVTLPQLRVLYFLRRHPASTTGELARRLGITVSTTSGLVIKLVDRGLVTRSSLADDRRQAPLSLNDAGAALLGELSDEPHTFLDGVAERLGERLDTITQVLEQLAEASAVEGASAVESAATGTGATSPCDRRAPANIAPPATAARPAARSAPGGGSA